MIDEVIRFNATDVPVKMGAFSQYDHPHTVARYAEMADALGLKGKTDADKVEALIAALDAAQGAGRHQKDHPRLRRQGGGLPFARLDEMVEQAFDDQCTGANPRYPLMSEIKQMYLNAYYGTHQNRLTGGRRV